MRWMSDQVSAQTNEKDHRYGGERATTEDRTDKQNCELCGEMPTGRGRVRSSMLRAIETRTHVIRSLCFSMVFPERVSWAGSQPTLMVMMARSINIASRE